MHLLVHMHEVNCAVLSCGEDFLIWNGHASHVLALELPSPIFVKESKICPFVSFNFL